MVYTCQGCGIQLDGQRRKWCGDHGRCALTHRPVLTECVWCGESLPPNPYKGNPRRYCSRSCNDRSARAEGRRKPTAGNICESCGALHYGKFKLCPTCKCAARIKQPRSPKNSCADCGTPAYGLRCRICANQAMVVRHLDDPHRQRRQREQHAPGLNSTKRSKLLHKWKRQDSQCAYCSEPATTTDHVIALVRGGTNYEGNLTPCCRSCNASKCARTVMEWRLGKPAPRMVTELGWTPTPP